MKKILFVFLLIFFFCTRLYTYLKSSVPLGYDSGLYLYLFKQYSNISLFSYLFLPKWMIEMYPPGIAVLGRLLSIFIDPERFLVPLIIFFSFSLFIAVYILAKKLWNQRIAIWTTFILSVSALQFRAYSYYYLKNIAAMSFLLFAYYFLISQSWWAVIFSILVIYFHRPTAAFLFASLLAGIIFQKEKRKFYLKVLTITVLVGTIYYLPTFERTVLPLLLPIFKSTIPQAIGGTLGRSSGTFYEHWQALLLALPYFPFALYGLKKNFTKKNVFLIAPLLLSFIVVTFKLFFNRRIIIFLDLYLILFTGVGLVEFLRKIKSKKLKRVFSVIYPITLIIFISIFIYKTAIPQIYEDEFAEIKKLSETEAESYVLVTDEAYMPWVYGWSNRKTIAPGYGEYDIYWDNDDWLEFYELGDREMEKRLLLKFPKPLYIYDGDHQLWSPKNYDFSGPCFERTNWRTFKFICN